MSEPSFSLRERAEQLIAQWRRYRQQPTRSFNVGDDKPQRWVDAENRLIDAFVRDLESLLIALALPVEQTWQPIETAPKDGTRILVMGKGPRWQLGPVVARTLSQYDGWYSLPGKYYLDEPTLWMPLPPTPDVREQL